MEVGEAALTGALRVLLLELSTMLGDEYKLQKDAKEEIRYIPKELQRMQVELQRLQVVLQQLSEVPPDQLDPQVELWAKLRDMAYQLENTVDSWGIDIRGIATKEAKRRDMYKVDGIIAPPPKPSDPRLPALYQDVAKHVGIDHSTEQIMELLSMKHDDGEEEMLRLVAIVGPAGMGKTTLVDVVYQKLKDHFDCTAFVSVSPNPNIKNILGSILGQVNSTTNDVSKAKAKSILRQESHHNHGNTDNWSKEEIMIDKIREVLEDKRYLIIIDGIWDVRAWKYLECVLVPNRLGSKIITTTLNIDVAKSCCSLDNVDGTIHQLGPLSDVESEKLFYHKVFGRGKCPPELKGISRKILGKCKGWPLAIISIASLLANKRKQTEDQWLRAYNSMGRGLENTRGVNNMRFILSLRDMPRELRACFYYLSMFPENHVIGRHDLIWRWIAENFVHGKQDDDSNNLYEVGDDYFNELINRNMIQPAQVDTLGRAQACTVHYVVLEFIKLLSAEDDFVTILNGQPFPFERERTIRRLSLRNSKEEHGVPEAVKRLHHLRTLVVSSRAATSMPSLSIFPLLRVLDLEDCTSHNIKDVGILSRLRYLKLSQAYYGSHHIELPQGIGALENLQILDLKDIAIQGLPVTLVQLRHLRVLKLSIYSWDKRYEKCLIQCLCNLNKLESLYISVAPNVSLDFMLTVDWPTPYLRRFTARSHEQNEHILRPGSVWRELSSFSTLPRWINSSLSSLSDLSIMVRKLEQRDVEILAQLPILVTLELEVVQACEEGRLVISGHEGAFWCLSNLKFASRALGLLFKPGAMQKLHKLYLCFSVADTKEVHFEEKDPFLIGLENLTCLKVVDVEIDCRGAWSGELEAAEAALRTAANSNQNQPAFDVRRYFEREMLSAAPRRLETVTFRSGNVIDLLSYNDHNGKQYNAGPWGGSGWDVYTAQPTDMPLSFLRQITNDFSHYRQIGTGGFAVVYKGILQNGAAVAVKKLNITFDMDEKKFNQEVEALMKTKHKNVVRFLGYCADTQGEMMEHEGKFIMADSRNRLLCFEYLPNGSLDKYIKTDALRELEWRVRYQIIKGIAQGLHYLHDKRILHLDLKPANILVDATMTPKIADFGLSRCFHENQTRDVTSKVAGTMGYLAPESFKDNSNIQITFKSDIFSLGVIIMEILTGKRDPSPIEDVVESLKNRLKLDTPQVEQVRVCAEIGIQCMDLDPAKRPLTPHIIHRLDHSSVQTGTSTTTTTSSPAQVLDYRRF